MRFYLTTAISAILATQLHGADVGLLVSNNDYDNFDSAVFEQNILDAESVWQSKGLQVSRVENGDIDALTAALTQFEKTADGSGRIVIAANAVFTSSASQSWLLGVGADTPSLFAPSGINVSALIEVASRAPGQSVVLLGSDVDETELDTGLKTSALLGTIPQGVTVITGPSDDIAKFATDALLINGQSLAIALQDWPSLTGHGFLAPLVPFYLADDEVVAEPVDVNATERAFWTATKNIDTIDAYRGYLNRYNDGLFVTEAQAEITRIENAPALRAEATEAALRLTRDQRREIQRSLSLIGIDPRGIDGVFGPGSRAAISAYQTSLGQDATGFITRDQINDLEEDAELRALELEREAAIRQAELEKKDRAYWEATGALGDEAGLRAYLARYPDGVFAEIATARLEPFEAERRAQAQIEDRELWDSAQATNTLESYQQYLASNPNGAFAEQAREQIAQLDQTQRNAEAIAAAERNEARLGLNVGARRLVEDRLDKAGLKPGVVDGTFDADSRRAIRRFQEARNLTKTGYLNQATMVRLLADAVFR